MDLTDLVKTELKLQEYQITPTLLDPLIPSTVNNAISLYLTTHSNEYLHVIYTLCKVRGFKVVSQHFPTSHEHLTRVFDNLSVLDLDWKSQYVLLLWLSTIILVPFDLESIKTGITEEIYVCGVKFLEFNGIQKDAAAQLLGRLFTRVPHQTSECVTKFMNDVSAKPHSKIGYLMTMSVILKRSNFVPQPFELIIYELNSSDFTENLVVLRYFIKILGRSACLNVNNYAEIAINEFFNLLESESSRIRFSAAKYLAKVMAKLDAELFDQVFQTLLSSLDEKIEYASADYWNGSLITIAELLRIFNFSGSGTVGGSNYADQIVNILTLNSALHFMQERLVSHIGGNVRDAACYVCWSLFRSKLPTNKQQRTKLYNSLICLAIMDTEVNVRRAAAAALQEGLGRYGTSSNDLEASEMFEIIELINFHSVGLITNCMLNIVPKFEYVPDFHNLFIEHVKTSPEMQRLAAQTVLKFNSLELLVDSCLSKVNESSLNCMQMVLGSLYTNYPLLNYRIEEVKSLYKLPNYTDFEIECALYVVPLLPEKALEVFEMVSTDSLQLREIGVKALNFVQETGKFVDLCLQRMKEFPIFAFFLANLPHCARGNTTGGAYDEHLLEAFNCGPECRAYVIPRIFDLNLLSIGLNDYTTDMRGDIGSLVRTASLHQLRNINGNISDSVLKSVYRISAEGRDKVREIAWETLSLISSHEITSFDDLLKYTPPHLRPSIAEGLVSNIGSPQTNQKTSHLAFKAVVLNGSWILPHLLKVDKSTVGRASCLTKTIKKLAVYGLELPPNTLAIIYNLSLHCKLPISTLTDCIDILQVLYDHPKSQQRLLDITKSSKYPGEIRQRAAEAIFELQMLRDDYIETTDFTLLH